MKTFPERVIDGYRFRLIPRDETLACGIYFLFKKGEVIYVGQSIDIASRVERHRVDRMIPFDHYAYFDYESDDLCRLERHFIQAFTPRYNTANNRRKMVRVKRPKRKKLPDRQQKAFLSIMKNYPNLVLPEEAKSVA